MGLKNRGRIVDNMYDVLSQSYDGFTYTNNFIYKNNYVVIRDRENAIYSSNKPDEEFTTEASVCQTASIITS